MSKKTKPKNSVGKPPIYKTEEELQAKLDAYFLDEKKEKHLPSKPGLRVFLGFRSREVYSDYLAKYPDTMKEAESQIERAWVERLSSIGATGAIFYLKNAFRGEYVDKHETDLTSDGKAISGVIVVPASNAPLPPPQDNEGHTD